MNDRTAVADLQAVADKGLNTRRIVRCNASTLNTPYKAGLTAAGYGTAYIGMISINSGTILYVCDSVPRAFLRAKDGGTWGNWIAVTTNDEMRRGVVQTLQDLGISGLLTTEGLVSVIPAGAYHLMVQTSGNSGVTDLPSSYGEMIITKVPGSLKFSTAWYIGTNGISYRYKFHGNDANRSGWEKIITSTDLQSGIVESIDCSGNNISIYNVTFSHTFSEAPHVIASLYSNTSSSDYGNISVMATMITKTGFRIKVANANSGSYAPGVSWIACAS